MRLTFLGCSDSKGVPRVGCECEVCRNVLSPGQPRLPDRIIGGAVLRPALRPAGGADRRRARVPTASDGAELRQIDAVLITHAHDDHILGFSTLVNAQRLAERQLSVYAPDSVLDEVRERFEYIWTDKTYRKVIQPQAMDGSIDLWGLGVRPLRMDHGLTGRPMVTCLPSASGDWPTCLTCCARRSRAGRH